MKQFVCVLAVVFAAAVTTMGQEAKKESFGEKEYDAFHKILRPLQHKALPAKDFKTIREKTPALVEKGKAIVALKVPAEMPKKAEYEKTVKLFAAALEKLTIDAGKSKDDALRKSYVAVHDTYEKLVSLLPD
ncbi:MAG: hypothetical protein NTV54_14360 [Ignavibacteriales bacterium]|nr:hypothetical protein [Ignavibacteriales bacterium]